MESLGELYILILRSGGIWSFIRHLEHQHLQDKHPNATTSDHIYQISISLKIEQYSLLHFNILLLSLLQQYYYLRACQHIPQ